MNRRDLIKGTLVAGALTAAPARALAQAAYAQPRTGSLRDRALFDIAKRELDKAGDVIWKKDIVGIADYGLRSSEARFHFVNLGLGEVKSYHVSHGTGSDPEHDGWLNSYSNVEGSNATSKGAYVTWEWYKGRYGTSVRLGGLDSTNDNALRRYIVMHRAAYAEQSHLERWGRLGRSNGCFAMGEEQFRIALLNLSGGRLLYADSLGLAADGTAVSPPSQEAAPDLEVLRPQDPRGSDILNPGVF